MLRTRDCHVYLLQALLEHLPENRGTDVTDQRVGIRQAHGLQPSKRADLRAPDGDDTGTNEVEPLASRELRCG
jgi:hypothetical protein